MILTGLILAAMTLVSGLDLADMVINGRNKIPHEYYNPHRAERPAALDKGIEHGN